MDFSLLALELALGFIVFAILRLIWPVAVDGKLTLLAASASGAVTLAAVALLRRSGATFELAEDAPAFLRNDLVSDGLVALGALVVVVPGWDPADSVAALLVSTVALVAALRTLRSSGAVLLEASPENLAPEEIGLMLAAQPGVLEVHDLHVREIASDFPALSAHVVIPADRDYKQVRNALVEVLQEHFNLHHITLQVDHEMAPSWDPPP